MKIEKHQSGLMVNIDNNLYNVETPINNIPANHKDAFVKALETVIF